MITKITDIISEPDYDLICLEETIFHPRGGGQPGDQGFIIKEDENCPVLDTVKKEGRLYCKVDKDHELSILDEVALEIDFRKRKLVTRMHTAEHILYKCLEKTIRSIKLNKIALGFTESTIVVSAPDIDVRKILEAEKLANKIVAEDRKVIEHNLSLEKARSKFPDLRLQEHRLDSDIVRVVEIKNFDVSACKGTHLDSTREVKNILVTGINTQGKSFFEVKFKVDIEAELFELADIARLTQASMGVDFSTLLDSLENLKKENEDLKKQVNTLSKGIKVEVKKKSFDNFDFLYAYFPGISRKQLVKKIDGIEDKKTVTLFLNDARDHLMVALKVSQDLDLDAESLLQSIFNSFPGKGGGEKHFAQGNISLEDPGIVIKIFGKLLG